MFSKPAAQVALAKQEYHYVNREGNMWGKNRNAHLSDRIIASKNTAGCNRIRTVVYHAMLAAVSGGNVYINTYMGYTGVLLCLSAVIR